MFKGSDRLWSHSSTIYDYYALSDVTPGQRFKGVDSLSMLRQMGHLRLTALYV
jgi:hypothetical protein